MWGAALWLKLRAACRHQWPHILLLRMGTFCCWCSGPLPQTTHTHTPGARNQWSCFRTSANPLLQNPLPRFHCCDHKSINSAWRSSGPLQPILLPPSRSPNHASATTLPHFGPGRCCKQWQVNGVGGSGGGSCVRIHLSRMHLPSDGLVELLGPLHRRCRTRVLWTRWECERNMSTQ